MSALSVSPPYPIFSDADGQPLEDGYVWLGLPNQDPQVNATSAYWDAALTQPAPRPIRTLDGYPSNSGTPARIYVNGDYSIRVTDKNGSVVYNAPTATDRFNEVVITGLNAVNVIYDPAGLGAVQTNVQEKLREIVSVKDYGAVGDGVTDDRAAIVAAISANDVVYFPPGDYYLSSKITFTTPRSIRLIGAGGFDCPASRLLCANITGYTFELALPDSTQFQIEFDGLEFDGRPNGTGAWTVSSTSWLGAIYNTSEGTTPTQATFTKVQVNNCVINYSNAPGAVGLDLRSAFWVNVTNTRIAYFPFGYATRCGTFNVVSTTIVFRKCYLNYNQHCMRIDGNVINVELYDTVFESSVVAFSALTTTMLLSGCYFENIGYSLDNGAVANTGLIDKDFGINFVDPTINTPVISAINLAYSEVLFSSCLFAYRGTMIQTLHPGSRWLYMFGRGSTISAGNGARFDSCRVSTFQNTTFLESVSGAGQNFIGNNGCAFEWIQGSRLYYLPYSDIRNCREGNLFVEFPSTGSNPTYAMQCEVKRGRMIVYNPGFSVPVNSPIDGQWEEGDILYFDTPVAGGHIGAVCTTAGTPGTWKTFGAISP